MNAGPLTPRDATPGAEPNPAVAGQAARRGPPGITRNVVALGAVSFLTDVSSEMIVPVLPLFVTVALGASAASVGVIEGVAESTASLLRIGSGWLSDRIGRRKPFLLFGYGLSAVAKTTLAVAASWPAVLGLRFADRVGKGLRNPPRDALIADSVERRHLGRAFGFHRGFDTLGAAVGPLVTFLLLQRFPERYRLVFLLSAIPAALSLVVLGVFVRAPRPARPAERRALGLGLRGFRPAFYRFLLVAGLFSLANSSAAFLILLASRAGGLSPAQITLVYLGYNLIYALLSWPIGTLSDRVGRRPMLLAAYALFAAIYGLLAWRSAPATILPAFALLGLHSALLEGSQRSMVGDLVADDRRATAFGLYYTVVGAALLPASWIAGALWDRFRGPAVMLATDAVLAGLAALLFALLLPARDEWRDRHHAEPA